MSLCWISVSSKIKYGVCNAIYYKKQCVQLMSDVEPDDILSRFFCQTCLDQICPML